MLKVEFVHTSPRVEMPGAAHGHQFVNTRLHIFGEEVLYDPGIGEVGVAIHRRNDALRKRGHFTGMGLKDESACHSQSSAHHLAGMICSRYHIVEIQVAEVEQVSWQAKFTRGIARCGAGRRLRPPELACKIDLLIVGDCLVRKHQDGVLGHGVLYEREHFRFIWALASNAVISAAK